MKYSNVEILFQYLQSDPSKLTFNHIGKYLLIQDYVGKRPAYTQISVKQKGLSPIELNEVKL